MAWPAHVEMNSDTLNQVVTPNMKMCYHIYNETFVIDGLIHSSSREQEWEWRFKMSDCMVITYGYKPLTAR